MRYINRTLKTSFHCKEDYMNKEGNGSNKCKIIIVVIGIIAAFLIVRTTMLASANKNLAAENATLKAQLTEAQTALTNNETLIGQLENSNAAILIELDKSQKDLEAIRKIWKQKIIDLNRRQR